MCTSLIHFQKEAPPNIVTVIVISKKFVRAYNQESVKSCFIQPVQPEKESPSPEIFI